MWVIIKRVRHPIWSNPGEPTPILPGGALDIHGTEAAAGVVAVMLNASRGSRRRREDPESRGIIFGSRRFVSDFPVQSGIESPGHKRFPDIEDRLGMTPDGGSNLCIGFVGIEQDAGMGDRGAADSPRRMVVSREDFWSAISVTVYLLFP